MFIIYDEANAVDEALIAGMLETLCKRVFPVDSDPVFSVHFITDQEIRDLNRTYRDIDEPTDILTFCAEGDDFIELPDEEEDLGDIFISLESMRRNAEAFAVSVEEELRRLLVHGLLHLRGEDHATNDFGKEPMLIEQESILRELGWKA